jgi:hypothetical protein
VSKGGTNDINNLVTACEDCNLGKQAQFAGGYRREDERNLLKLGTVYLLLSRLDRTLGEHDVTEELLGGLIDECGAAATITAVYSCKKGSWDIEAPAFDSPRKVVAFTARIFDAFAGE